MIVLCAHLHLFQAARLSWCQKLIDGLTCAVVAANTTIPSCITCSELVSFCLQRVARVSKTIQVVLATSGTVHFDQSCAVQSRSKACVGC